MNRILTTVCAGAVFIILITAAVSQSSAQGNPPVSPAPTGLPVPFGPVFPPLPQAPSAPQPPMQPGDIEELRKCLSALGASAPFSTCERMIAEQATWDVRFFELKYASPLVVRDALGIFRANINTSSNLRLLSVKAPKEIMPAIEDAVKRLDVPSPPRKPVELTLYLLRGSDPAPGSAAPATAATIPQTLQPVINQLKNVFSYKLFQLVDALILMGLDGQRIETNGILPGYAFSLATDPPVVGRAEYSFQAPLSLQMTDSKDPVLRLDQFRFNLTVPYMLGAAYNSRSIGINTVVEVHQGQQVVVGKATVGDSALILVLSAKIM